jgi:hypothetical protein
MLDDQWIIEKLGEQIKKFQQSNDNENTNYQDLWSSAKAVIREKFITMSIYIKRKKESSNK